MSNHTSAQELLELDRSLDKDLRRFEEPKLSEYLFSMPPPRKKVKTTEQLFVAKFLSTINKELKLYDRTLGPSASWILRLRLWDAEKFEKDDVYMISYRHGYVYWVVPMQLCTNSTVEWELPIKAVPLYEVVRRLYSIACESAPTIISAEATYVNIKWVFNCFSKAAIHDELPLLDRSNFLKPTRRKRASGPRSKRRREHTQEEHEDVVDKDESGSEATGSEDSSDEEYKKYVHDEDAPSSEDSWGGEEDEIMETGRAHDTKTAIKLVAKEMIDDDDESGDGACGGGAMDPDDALHDLDVDAGNVEHILNKNLGLGDDADPEDAGDDPHGAEKRDPAIGDDLSEKDNQVKFPYI